MENGMLLFFHAFQVLMSLYITRAVSLKILNSLDVPIWICAECGRPYTNPTALISGGVEERFGDSPWHAAVYNQDKVLICGGTIINPHLVVSG